MTNFEVIIGIENHTELKTKSKMFAPALNTYGMEPNSKVSSQDLGYPGALPNVNKQGVKLAILICNALNMKIDRTLIFDRKNYFYPDLVKGFQITQFFNPIGSEGYLEARLSNGKTKKFEIERLHIEEDTAKQNHIGDKTFIDYNRSGIGLAEIVSKPVMRSAEEAVVYVEKLREVLIFTGASDAKMNEGSLRCDVNISLRPIGFDGFGNKVEIKNLNSLNNVKKAIEFEIKRQTQVLLSGKEVIQETRRFDESIQETVSMREKSDSIDYKYIREPNIFPIKLDDEWVNGIIANAPELADQKRKKYISVFGLDEKEVNYILSNINLTNFFEETISYVPEYKKVVNYIIGDIKNFLNKDNSEINEHFLTPKKLSEIILKMNDGIISSKHAKQILEIVFNENKEVEEIIEKLDLKLISDKIEIKNYLISIIEQNKDLIINQYESRPERVEKQIMGQLMKITHGNVNPEIGMEIIKKEIKNIK